MLRFLIALLVAALTACTAVAKQPAPEGYAGRTEVRSFAADLAVRRGLDRDWVLAQLAQARPQPTVQRLIMPAPAGAAKDWSAYRDRFVEPRRIAAGLAFWEAHEDVLKRAEQRFGVPAAVVVGIVGVETFYGRVMGNYRILEALATLGFDFPAGRSDRSAYFRSELEEFLVLARREGVNPLQQRGSFAGAIGLPQFMPGSINRFAIDFDGDGQVDLANSAADAIGSIANFLVEHGWQRGMVTHYAVGVPTEAADRALLLAPDILPSFSAAQFAERGAMLPEAGRAHEGLLALVMVENGAAAPSHVAGTQNFYVLTRYNRSSYYALAVIDLGVAVQAAWDRARK